MKWETAINDKRNKEGVNMNNDNGLLEIIYLITGILFIILLVQMIKERKQQKALQQKEEIILNQEEEETIYVFEE